MLWALNNLSLAEPLPQLALWFEQLRRLDSR
jgi:hypothetical protein